MRKENKRGQVTIFIIIGIILLFSTAIVLFIKGKVQQVQPELEVPKVAKVPAEVQPIADFITDCTQKTLKEGIDILESQGGFIDTSQFNINPIDPTEANAVELFPDSGIKIPYWYHLKSRNDCTDNCQFEIQQPPLCKAGRKCVTSGKGSVEEQLQDYVANNIKKCADFSGFADKGYSVREVSKPTVTVIARRADVVASIKWPIEITLPGGAKQDIQDYVSQVSSKLTQLYEVADQLKNYETNNCFVEKQFLNRLSLYQGLGPGELPPPFQQTFGESSKIWVKSGIEPFMQRLTADSARATVIYNTTGFQSPTAPSGDYKDTRDAIYDQSVFFALNKFYDASIRFFYYPWWSPYFDIKPNIGGEVITPAKLDAAGGGFFSALMTTLSITNYEFYYMYSYPETIEVKMFDDKDRTKQELFRFAIEANIRSNKCLKPNATFILQSSASSSLCDPEFRGNTNYTIGVFDDYNKTMPLPDTAVYFQAGDNCLIGYTDANGTLKTTLPKAFGGFLNFKKDGYLGRYIHQDDFTINLKTTLRPFIDKEFNQKFIDTTLLESVKNARGNQEAIDTRDAGADAPHKDEFVIMSLKRIPDSYQDEQQQQTVVFQSGKWSSDTLKLTPGIYEVTIQNFLKRNITLPEEHDRICTPAANPPDWFGKGFQDILKGISPGCVKTPVDANCNPRGDSRSDYMNGDCYKQGYTCESINDALKKNSGAVTEAGKIACINGYNGLGKFDLAKITGNLVSSTPCQQKVCAADQPVDIQSQSIDITPAGGADVTQETEVWAITDYDSLVSGNLTMFAFRQNPPERIWDLQDATIYKNWSKQYRFAIEPEIK